MKLRQWLSMHSVRHALSVGMAVALTLLMSHHLSVVSPGWMVITALLVCQTTRGSPLRQNIIYFFFIILGVLLASLLNPIFFNWTYDVMLGGVIGVLCSQLILPVRPFEEFRKGLLPVMQMIVAFNNEMVNLLVDGNGYINLQLAAQEVKKALQERYSMYPEWVYEVGFNPGLRSGYRFFLVNIERVTEIIFSLNYRIRLLKSMEACESLINELRQVMLKNNHLLHQLEQYFATGEFAESKDDFTSDVVALDEKVKQVLPPRLELLDIYPDNVTLATIIRDVKDMRQLLLLLVLAATTKQAPKR